MQYLYSPSKNAAEDFLGVVTRAHILSAAMHFMKMKKLEDNPSTDVIPDCSWLASKEERRDLLQSVSSATLVECTFLSKQLHLESCLPLNPLLLIYTTY